MREASLGIIFNPDKSKILLIKRCDVPVWVLPGGGIEQSESPEEAAQREVLEETGLRVTLVRKTGYYTPINRLASVTHVYECAMSEGRLRTGSETGEIAFWPLEKLPSNFFEVHRDWLEDALQEPEKLVKKSISRVTYTGVARYALLHPLLFLRFLWTRLTKD